MKHYFIEVNVIGDDGYDENYRFIIEGKKKEAQEDAILQAVEKFANDGGENPTAKIIQCYETFAEASVD